MDILDHLSAFSNLDLVALGLLLALWAGAGLLIEHAPASRPSVTKLMSEFRRAWMCEMVTRDPRIFDAQILSSLRQGTSFFASSCLIAIGGVLAMVGNAESLAMVAQDLTLGDQATVIWQGKLLVVALLLTHAFLKFVWANRLFGYCAVVMAATPNQVGPLAEHRAGQAAEINVRAALNFNRGLRSIYFALASLAWLLGSVPFLMALALTSWTLLSREFVSHSRDQLLKKDP